MVKGAKALLGRSALTLQSRGRAPASRVTLLISNVKKQSVNMDNFGISKQQLDLNLKSKDEIQKFLLARNYFQNSMNVAV